MATAITQREKASAKKVNKYLTVDADGHVVEPPWMWQEYLEPAYREYAPTVVKLDDGNEWVIASRRALPGDIAQGTAGVSSNNLPSMSMPTAAALIAGRDWVEHRSKPFRTGIKGAYDPHARIPDMEQDGIDMATLYPTTMLGFVADPGYSGARCRAYNNWLADYVKPYPKRLFGVASVPLPDIPASITELKRAVKDLGFKGVFLRPNPYVENTPFYSPFYSAFWAECQALNIPVGLHVFLRPDMPGICRAMHMDAVPTHYTNVYFTQSVSNPMDLMLCVTWFCAAGVLERFPTLKVVFLEGNGGWLMSWLERLDHHSKIWRSEVPWQSKLPSEWFASNCYISFDADEKMLVPTAKELGSHCIIWASDYPHPDAKLPGVVEELVENVEKLPAKDQENILGMNAVRLYSLPKTR
jgi:predicted TIM-barrel fold metal-dependent hydrolase